MSLNSADLVALFVAVAEAIEDDKGRLSELDGVIGDGDHGVTMSIGFLAVRKALDGLDAAGEAPTAVFNTAAKSFLGAVGASAGPLYATAFMRAGAAVKDKASIDAAAMADVIAAMAKGVQDRGKAESGEKTMVDAWLPAATAAQAAAGSGSLATVLQAAAVAAAEGAESTRQMVATKGRSANLGERSLGHIDPGAASTALIVATMAKAVESPAE
ncbi:dihydroxyacetone kinase subunit L [Pelagibius litoralis]|uniref:Dihydroxyacetone kinase subunit L n=1 Tax=Pelagibius litoralis TaxID=374515 RepID=A0A967EY23_9PROT|nr:dihydroxyacetone kinase subunit L [Pelagibius litoralis]